MNRRSLFSKLAEWAGALGLSGLAVGVEAKPVAVTAGPVLYPQCPVHWVNVDRRHVEAMLTVRSDGTGYIEYQQRPAVQVGRRRVCSRQFVDLGARWREHQDQKWVHHAPVGTWHTAEICECGRPYSEWWYGRRRVSLEEQVTPRPDAGRRNGIVSFTGKLPEPRAGETNRE